MTTSRLAPLLVAAASALFASSCDVAPAEDGEIIGASAVIRSVRFEPVVSSYIIASEPLSTPIEEVADRRVVLVDTGVDGEDEEPLTAALEAIGRTPDDVTAIFLTHGHQDHIGNVPDFPSATVYAFYGDIGLIEGTAAARRPLPSGDPEPTGVTVDEVLIDGQRLSIAGIDIRAFSIPGHTDGSAAFLADGVLFLGDTATVNSAGELNGPTWIFSTDVERSDASLARLESRLWYEQEAVTHLACSHSAPVADGAAVLRRYVDGLQDETLPGVARRSGEQALVDRAQAESDRADAAAE